jgi:predicted transcriptional regulator YheO
MTPEMALGRSYEKRFRKWISGLIQSPENNGVLQYDFVVNSGAERIGCSPETIKRYLKKLTSKAGAYEWLERDELYLKLKDMYRET